MKISAVIITFNESANIERCIQSLLPIADEVLVVDSFSTDNTRELAEMLGARVIQNPFEGHIQQKNYAKNQAQFPWVLSLDADEALTADLIKSIQEIKQNGTQYKGFTMNRLNGIANRWIKTCGWYPDRKLRLWLKDQGEWGGRNPHDRFELYNEQTPGHLNGDLLHYSYATWDEVPSRMNRYAEIGAKAQFEEGKGQRGWKRFISPYFEFFQRYIIRGGILDGKAGFLVSYWAAKSTYHKYKTLHQLHRKGVH